MPHLQSHMEPLFSDLRPYIKSRVHDFNFHSRDEITLLLRIERYLEIFLEQNFFVSETKRVFFKKSIKCCGRITDKDDYRLDPKNIKPFKNIVNSVSANDLCQLVHCCWWIYNLITDFHRRIACLNELLEQT